MKRTIMAAMMVAALIMGGCGSDVHIGTTITVPEYYAPEIGGLQFVQDTGREIVSGSFEFWTGDYNLDTMTIVVHDSLGREISRSATDLRSFWGYSSGILYFSIDYYTFPPDRYTFTIYVTDRAGYFSNGLYGTFAAY